MPLSAFAERRAPRDTSNGSRRFLAGTIPRTIQAFSSPVFVVYAMAAWPKGRGVVTPFRKLVAPAQD
jgi:hypothetical protein